MSKNKKTIIFTVKFHPNNPKETFSMRFSDAQMLYDHVRAYFDKVPGNYNHLLIESETVTENIHKTNQSSSFNKEQSDHKKKKIEVIRWSPLETMTRGFLQWVRDHGVKINSEPKFQVIIEQKYPTRIYVNFTGDEAQNLYDFVKRDLWVHGEPLRVIIDTDKVPTGKTNHMMVKEISRYGQITPEFLPWLNSFGFNVRDENVR